MAVKFKNSININDQYTFPSVVGTDGQYLSITDAASGTLDWTNISDVGGVAGSGTTNYVPKWTDGDTIGNSVIYDDGTNVGIGTTSLNTISGSNPTLTLSGTGVSGGLILKNAGTDTARIYETGNLLIHQGMTGIGHSFYVNASAEAMRITSTGSVGIGTTSPSHKLHIKSGVANVASTFESEDTVAYINVKDSDSSTYGALFGAVGNDIILANGAGATERMRIDSSGNVGIGQSTMIGTAAGRVALTIGGSTSAILNFGNAGTRWGGLYAGSGDYAIYSDSLMRLETAGSERMRITSSGNVGIDTASPSHKFHVHSSTNNDYAARFEGSTINSAGAWTGIGIGGEANNTKSAIIFEDIGESYSRGKLHLAVNNELNQNNATKTDAKLTISNNGNVGIGTSSPLNRTHIVGPTLTTGNETTYGLAVSDVGDETKTLILGYDLVNDVGIIQAIDQQTAWKNLALGISGDTKVGVGEIAPTAKLHIKSPGNATLIRAYSAGYKAMDLWGATNGSQLTLHGGAEAATIVLDGRPGYNSYFTTGNVGVGTASPAYTLDVSGTIRATSDMRAPIFYDSNNTARYLDPAGTSSLGNINMNNSTLSNLNNLTFNDPGPNEGIEWIGGNGWKIYESPDNLTTNSAGSLQFVTGSTRRMAIDPNGNTFSLGSSRAPIFYDSDNTGYYLNPAGTSQLTAIYYNEWVRNNNSSASGLHWEANAPGYGWHMYPQNRQDMTFRTGSGNGGIKGTVVDDTARGYIHWTTSNEIGFLNSSRSWSLRVDNNGNTFATGSHRAPVFYDADNTGYYLNPASTSNLNQLNVATLNVSNDGSGSGLDADLLDGQHASAFAASSHTHTWANILGETANSVNGWGGLRHQTNYGYIDFGPANSSHAHIYTDRPSFYLNKEILINNNIVWNAGNDGSGSGLDADLLDGQQGSYYAIYDHIRSLGTQGFTGTATTAGLISEMESDGAFDSYTSVFKTSWSYAGNFDLSDAGRFTETAGTSWITWTDNSSDSVRGNITALAIAPNTGGSAGKVFIYNDQGSGYAPGWREVWTSLSDGAGSGLDADLLDGLQSSFAPTGNTIPIRDASGDISAREIVLSSGLSAQVPTVLVSMYPNTNQLVRTTPAAVAASMGAWTSSNDGSGSGLDADLIDGIDSSRIVFGNGSSKVNSQSNANSQVNSGFYENAGGGTNWPSTTWYNSINVRHSNQGNYHGFQAAMSYYDNLFWFRSYQGSGTFQAWEHALSSGSGTQTKAGILQSSSSLRAPIFYDSGNTAYYVDPASTSNINDLNVAAKRTDFSGSTSWDAVGFGSMTNLHMQGHGQFWFGAGNGTWFTGTANAKTQASGLAADANSAHDLLITTMQSTSTTDRGITFAVDSSGAGTAGWRLGKWHSGTSGAASLLAVDGTVFAKGGYTDEYDYYTNDYSVYHTSGKPGWPGDTNSGWHKPSLVASSAILIQSGNNGTNSRKPQIQFHQYGYGGPGIEYDGPNKKMTFGELGTSNPDRINSFHFRFDNTDKAIINSDYMFHNSDMRSPIFYDSNNTGYYTNPASTSNLNQLNVVTLNVSGTLTGTASGNLTNGSNEHLTYVHRIHASDGTSPDSLGFGNRYNTFNYGVSSGVTGPLLSFGALGDNYPMQITGTYSGGSLFKVRTRNGDTATWNAWRTLWHDGNDGSGSGLDADLLDGVQASQFLRSDATDSFSGNITFSSYLISSARDKGLFGVYDSTKTDQIWSMGTAYRNNSAGTNFGNLYGLAYKHTNNTTGGTMGGGHQMVWCNNGSPRGSIGNDRVWHTGDMQAGGNMYANAYYDDDNTVYYTDPASTSNVNIVNFVGYSSAFGGFQVSRNLGTTSPSWEDTSHTLSLENSDAGYLSINFHRGGYTSNNIWYTGAEFITDDTWRSTVEMKAPIFYDSDNTAYYLNPAGGSYLSYLGVGAAPNTSGSYVINMGGNIDMNNNGIDYASQLHFNSNVRFYQDSNDSYLNFKYGDAATGGIKFLNGGGTLKGYVYATTNSFGLLDSDGSWALRTQTGTNPLSLYCDNNEEFQVYTSYTLSLGSSRAPIFYDSNNTAYYVDPASGSYLGGTNSINVARETGVGLKIQGTSNGGHALVLNGGGYSSTAEIYFPSYATGMAIVNNGTSGQDAITFRFGSGSGNIVGGIRINTSSTTYATSSDYRLKENIVPMTGSLDRLMLLKPSRFNFIGNEEVVDGFIAHEAQEVVPEAVTGEKDSIGWDGNPDYQGIDQSKLVPLLTAALQEAVAKIESLESRIQALEEK